MNIHIKASLIISVSLTALCGCGQGGGSDVNTDFSNKPPIERNLDPGGVETFSGRVVFNDFEGGFYGILTDNNVGLLPLEGFSDEMKVDGLKVKGSFKNISGATLFMWGKPVKIFSVELYPENG